MNEQLNLLSATASKLILKRPLAFFDLESTGVDIAKDRIVEISVLKVNPDGSKVSKTMRINPTISIPIESSVIHGIYDEDVVTAPTFKQVAQDFFDLLEPCDFAGFNSNKFDIPMLLEEFIRAGINLNIHNRALIDVYRIYTLFEKRNLESAYKFYCNKSILNAHSAEADVTATYEVLMSQLEKYAPELKCEIAHLHDISNDEQFIDSGRRLVFMGGKPCFNFGKYKGKSVEDVLRTDSGYYNWMMNGDFSQHTKQKLTEIKESLRK